MKTRIETILEGAKDLSEITGETLHESMMFLLQDEHNREMVKGVKAIADKLEQIIQSHYNTVLIN